MEWKKVARPKSGTSGCRIRGQGVGTSELWGGWS